MCTNKKKKKKNLQHVKTALDHKRLKTAANATHRNRKTAHTTVQGDHQC